MCLSAVHSPTGTAYLSFFYLERSYPPGYSVHCDADDSYVFSGVFIRVALFMNLTYGSFGGFLGRFMSLGDFQLNYIVPSVMFSFYIASSLVTVILRRGADTGRP
jgi:hypothetical protein